MKIIALVITFNRSAVLQKSLTRLLAQQRPFDEILVINNCSTDNTALVLEPYKNQITPIHLNQNVGGAGAYFIGLKMCFERQADWVFCAEDDIVAPKNFAKNFAQILQQENTTNTAFFYPRLLSIHNRHQLDGFIYEDPTTQHQSYKNITKATFAGLLINAQLAKTIGLPIHSFFIYFDDWEYTQRLRKQWQGLHLPSLYLWHNDFQRFEGAPYLHAPSNRVWKNLYGIRNELFVLKQSNKTAYLKQLLKHVFYIPLQILLHRKENPVSVSLKWSLWASKSLFFSAKSVQYDSKEAEAIRDSYF